MDFSPQTVRSAGFKTVKKGYDPSEVDDFKEKVAAAIETAQNQATAMEARARAAVAKLQEVSQQVSTASPTGASQSTNEEDTETISRTLLLAQRTADNTVAQANADAESITVKARVDATTVIDNARSIADKLLDEARIEGRRSAESERIKAENEVQALLARREFLLSDVDHLEHHLGAQRERIRDAAVSLQDLIERVPGGLAEMRRPLLSASGESLLSASARPGEPSPASAPAEAAEQQDDVDDFADDATAAYDMAQDEEPGPAKYEFPSLMDATPSQMAATESKADDESTVMRLDLGSLDAATRPSWSQAGDDPLIIGGDELQ
jgi:DivIVA domain-containing protein